MSLSNLVFTFTEIPLDVRSPMTRSILPKLMKSGYYSIIVQILLFSWII